MDKALQEKIEDLVDLVVSNNSGKYILTEHIKETRLEFQYDYIFNLAIDIFAIRRGFIFKDSYRNDGENGLNNKEIETLDSYLRKFCKQAAAYMHVTNH